MADRYTLEICDPRPGTKSFQWAIRRNGRMYQRSDRHLHSADKAQEHGRLVLGRLVEGRADAALDV